MCNIYSNANKICTKSNRLPSCRKYTYSALICWVYTRSKKGKFLLRFDDTDSQRSKIEYIDNIIQDLKWIGIDWDEKFTQSERFERYGEVFLQLIKEGYIYPCYETKEELEIKRKLQLKQGSPSSLQ